MKAGEAEPTGKAQRLVKQVAGRSGGYSGEGRNCTREPVRDGLMDDRKSDTKADRS
jgi:hypothetical protein